VRNIALLCLALDVEREKNGCHSRQYRKIWRQIKKERTRLEADKSGLSIIKKFPELKKLVDCVRDDLESLIIVEEEANMGSVTAWTKNKIRKAKIIPVNAFARNLGISASTVSLWVNGKRSPQRASLQKIADYFDMELVQALKWLEDRVTKGESEHAN
jgi:hypothetical protein